MRQFFKIVFASCFGTILGSGALILLTLLIFSSFAAIFEEKPTVKPNSVLKLDFSQEIPERTNNTQIEFQDFKPKNILGLSDICKAIKDAATDDNITGIFLDLENFSGGQVKASTIRKALIEFKNSGKFIVAYSPYYTQGTYYLASTADEVYLHPMGNIDLKGFAAFVPYLKDMFDKIGINWQVIYKGKFKSASEPYRANEMSEENRYQIREYLSALFEEYLDGISVSREKSSPELKKISNELLLKNAKDALNLGLVDQLSYKEEVLEGLKKRVGLKENEKLKFCSLQTLWSVSKEDNAFSLSSKPHIAVIYAEGNIVNGKGENGSIGAAKYTEMIRKIRKDEDALAIVVRINSPGGSAVASEDIWHELDLARKAGKPVVATMGDLAASGGYYIACGADTILADPATLTGSIGVVGLLPNMQELLDDKLGIHFDTVKVGQFSDGINGIFPVADRKLEILKNETDSLYQTFLKRVAEARSISVDSVHQIAQGRVWAGKDALEIGLIDQFGDLDQAIEIARFLTGETEAEIQEYPKIKDPWQQLLEEYVGLEESTAAKRVLKQELGEYYLWYEYVQDVKEMEGIQARLPFLIKPQ